MLEELDGVEREKVDKKNINLNANKSRHKQQNLWINSVIFLL